MSVMPNLTSAVISDPDTYIAALRAALLTLKGGASHVRTPFGNDYLNFSAEDASELRTGIVRLESLHALGQFGGRENDIDNPMPWARPR
ncbi:hypothetical protein V1281_002635 [Nitrobacteraceae bacterium AZCC 2161]